jgi:hypothetical protein
MKTFLIKLALMILWPIIGVSMLFFVTCVLFGAWVMIPFGTVVKKPGGGYKFRARNSTSELDSE